MGDGFDQLGEAFMKAGHDHGYAQVTARFQDFKEFKAVWRRRAGTVDFEITDYMKGVPAPLMDDFAQCLFWRIKRRQGREIYTDALRNHFRSKEFVERNRPLYLARSRNLTRRSAGSAYELEDLMAELQDMDLIQGGKNVFLTWTKRPNVQRVGYCSVIMSVAAISSALDDGAVPRYVPSYVLYHELLHLENGLRPGAYHDGEFRRMERMHPHWEEAERELRRLHSRR